MLITELKKFSYLIILVFAIILPCYFLFSKNSVHKEKTESEMPHFEKTSLDNLTTLLKDEKNPAIPFGKKNDWDEYIREIGNILYEPYAKDNEKFKTFYSGYNGEYKENNVYIGYATSSDGINWKKQGKIINRSLEDPYVVKYKNVYYLFVEDKGRLTKKGKPSFRNIRRYHSLDCKNWIDDGIILDIDEGGIPLNWQNKDVSSPIVYIENGIWYLFYEGRGKPNTELKTKHISSLGKIGLAISNDGFHFKKISQRPIIDVGKPGDWDDRGVVPDDLIKYNNTYYLIYHGNGHFLAPLFCRDWACWRTGIAKSEDLIHFEKLKFNPINPLNGMSDTAMIYFNGKDFVFHLVAKEGIERFYSAKIKK